MPPAYEDDFSSLDEVAREAQRALKERPSLSIRTRLSLGFLLWFILSLGIALVSIVTISQIRKKLDFMEAATNYSFEIQQARRFEKNFFLYHTNLGDALAHVHKAGRIIEEEGENMAQVAGEENFRIMKRHVERYEELLSRLDEIDKNQNASPAPGGIEKELREHGAEMVTMAENIVNRERKAVNSMLLMSQRIPLVFLFFLLLLIVYLGFFISRQMLAPLNRMMQVTRRIADGDFTPITPKRKYHDEFSELAMAMNHMMHQLVHRHELLSKAQKLKAIGTLTAGVAHELNNPLNNIILTASMLVEDYHELSEEERMEYIHDMVGESERAQKIVRNLLDFARETEIESETFQVTEIIEEVLQLASNQIKLAKVKVKGEISENLAPVTGDRQQLAHVFLNLVLNALDAMPDGGTLSISVTNTPDRDFVAVGFTDTGVGIPEQSLNNVFDPFFTTKKKAKGTGLGLSVSLGIIKKHGGDIQVRSKVNEGTTFTVLLPVAKIPANIENTDS